MNSRNLNSHSVPAAVIYQLDDGYVLFPPEILLDAWAQTRKTIVAIHERVHQGIKHTTQEYFWLIEKQKLLRFETI
jgi:hypothetical protein